MNDGLDFAGKVALVTSRSIGSLLWLLLACAPLLGCRSLPPSKGQSTAAPATQTAAATNGSSAVLTNHPSQPCGLSTWKKFNPAWWFGNADEPVAPDWYRPGKCCRNFRWHVRNPCHNFTFYVIGIADKPFTRVGRFPESVGNPSGGWNWAVCRYKCLRLPFVDYERTRFRFYCGWRERGNFGMKLTFGRQKEVPPEKPEERAPPVEARR